MSGREEMLIKLISSIGPGVEIVIENDDKMLLAEKRNRGAKRARGEYLFFVDDDNYLEPGAIEVALEIASVSGVGVVGFMACYDDKKDYVADGGSMRNHLTGFTKGVNTNAYWPYISDKLYEVDEVANAFMMHSELFYELHGFDEKNFPMDMNESDLCKRIKDKGYKIVMVPKARCYHKSVTYSIFPTFRRALYAYHHGRGRINYSRKFNHGLRYWLHIGIFVPLFFCFYTASLLWRKNFKVIIPFWRGIFDGLRNSRTNKYQPR